VSSMRSFGSKQGILAAMIEGRAARMRSPLALPQVADRQALEKTLVSFGTTLVREVSLPAVTALFRLAVIEAGRSPEVARALDAGGRKTTRGALVTFLERAAAQGLIGDADPETVAAIFGAALGRSADEPRDAPRRAACTGSDRSASAGRGEYSSGPLSRAFGLIPGSIRLSVRSGMHL
jgi:AcrR family transcriptional regulator